jgi:2-methylcitrate dehydratase
MSIARDLSEAALEINYMNIPSDVTREMKRFILDALACAIGAYDAEPCRICRDVAREQSGKGEATLIGESHKVSVSSAIIANETMVRYLDYNDVLYFPKSPGKIGGAHPSDSLPAALALGERQHASGKQVIEAAVAAYETIGRMVDATAEGLTPMGFHHGSVMPFAGAVIAGKLLGLDASQMTNAMGIGASAAVGLAINDAEGEEYNNTKNIADGLMCERGVFGAFLAQRGFTGPERIIEGNKGFAHSLLRGVGNYIVKPRPNDYYLMGAKMKFYPTESTNQGHLAATSALVNEHDLAPDDIAEVVLRMSKRTVEHNGDPAKKYPRNKETADHSAYFITALGIVTRGRVAPSSFNDAAYVDPTILSLIENVRLEHGPEYDAITPAALVTIRTTDGRVLTKRVDHPRGNPENRMSDDELRRKFIDCAGTRMTSEQVDRVVEACLRLEMLDDIGALMPLLQVVTS